MNKRTGFTLIELLIVMAIAAILVTIAVPSFRDFIQNQRTTTQANNLVTAINVARSEATKRGQRVELCASSDEADCTGAWTDGWIVRDEDSEEVIRVWAGLPDSANLTEANGATNLVYNARGELVSGTRRFEVWFDDCTGDRQRIIRINAVGRPSVERTEGNCG